MRFPLYFIVPFNNQHEQFVDISQNQSIGELRFNISQKFNIPLDEINLVYSRGELRNNEEMLANYINQDVIHVHRTREVSLRHNPNPFRRVTAVDLLDASQYQLHWMIGHHNVVEGTNQLCINESVFSATTLPYTPGNALQAFDAFKKRIEKIKINENDPNKSTGYKKENAYLALVALPNRQYIYLESDNIYAGTAVKSIFDPNGDDISVIPISGIVNETFSVFENSTFALAFKTHTDELRAIFYNNVEHFLATDSYKRKNQEESQDEGGFTPDVIEILARSSILKPNGEFALTTAQITGVINYVKLLYKDVTSKQNPLFNHALLSLTAGTPPDIEIPAEIQDEVDAFDVPDQNYPDLVPGWNSESPGEEIKKFYHACLRHLADLGNTLHVQIGKKRRVEEADIPTDMPDAKRNMVAVKPNATRFVIALDHGGVLDGSVCESVDEEVYISLENDIILNRDEELTYFLKDGKAIFQILKELSERGCIITSHSTNSLADIERIIEQLNRAALTNHLEPIHFGTHVIYDKRFNFSADSPRHGQAAFFATQTFGSPSQSGRTGKAAIRDILIRINELASPDQLYVFDDDADEDYRTAVEDRCRVTMINGSGVSLLLALQQARDEILRRLDAAETQSHAVELASVELATNVSVPSTENRQVDAGLMKELFLDADCDADGLKLIYGEFMNNSAAVLTPPAMQIDDTGEPLLFRTIRTLPDSIAATRVQLVVNNETNPAIQAQHQGLTLEEVANRVQKPITANYLRNLRIRARNG